MEQAVEQTVELSVIWDKKPSLLRHTYYRYDIPKRYGIELYVNSCNIPF